MMTARTLKQRNLILKETLHYLWNYDVCKCLGAHEELLSTVVLKCLLVVLKVILDAVINVGDFANFKLPTLQLKIFFQFGPSANEKFPRLTIVQRKIWNSGGRNNKFKKTNKK